MAGDNEQDLGQAQVKEACEQLRAPAKVEWTKDTFSKVWKNWKEELQLYMDLAHANKQEEYKVKMLKYLIGETGREIYETLDFSALNKPEDQRTMKEVIDAFDQRAESKKNEIVERYTFFTRDQKEGENIEAYQTDLKLKAKRTCNFADLENSLIRDKIVCGIRSTSMRERLLQKENLTLESCVQMCKAGEISREQVKTIEKPENATANVDKVARKKKFQGKSGIHWCRNRGRRIFCQHHG